MPPSGDHAGSPSTPVVENWFDRPEEIVSTQMSNTPDGLPWLLE